MKSDSQLQLGPATINYICMGRTPKSAPAGLVLLSMTYYMSKTVFCFKSQNRRFRPRRRSESVPYNYKVFVCKFTVPKPYFAIEIEMEPIALFYI